MDRTPTIVLADDQATSREGTARVLRESGYRVVLATDGQDAVDKTALERPDVVILDVLMPRLGGIEACRLLKQKAAKDGDFLPILFVSARGDPTSRVEGLRAGAEDFLAKPYDPEELKARVEVLLRTRKAVDTGARALKDEGVRRDRLTGLHDGRYLADRLDVEFQRSLRYNEPLSLMAVDLDEFEKVNERGRSLGDRLLEAVGRTLVKCCRQVDLVTRGEGDDFVILLPNTHFSGSAIIAERVWREVRATAVEDALVRVSCEGSVGVACFPGKDIGTSKDLLRFTHAALARAKAEGRGRICLYQHQGYLFQPQ